MGRSYELAKLIVEEGWFVPSAQMKSTENDVYIGWLPLWEEPSLKGRIWDIHDAQFREAVEAEVDALVRSRLTPSLREEAFRALQPRYGVPHTPLERWVFALLNAREEAPSVPDWIAEDMTEWMHSVTGSRRIAPYRVAFALLEPGIAGTRQWMLIPGLQADDEETRFLSASRIWRSDSSDPVFEGRVYPAAHERLAMGLASAADLYSPLRTCDIRSIGCPLNEEEAVEFLESVSAQLEREGFGVVLPEWWERPVSFEPSIHFQEKRSAPLVLVSGPAHASRPLGFDTLVAYQKELMLSGEPVTEEEWRKLNERGTSVVRYRDRWLRITNQEKRNVERYFRQQASGEMPLGEALQTALSAGSVSDAQTFDAIQRWSAEGKIQEWIQGISRVGENVSGNALLPEPEGFAGTLRDYQQRGFSWLVRMRELGLGACLADDMGLGKTVQWIAYALHVIGSRKKDPTTGQYPPLLLLCPTSVLGNWLRELERFAPTLRVYFHYGPERRKGGRYRQEAAMCDIVITSYGTALRDRKLLAELTWDAMTLDEAQVVKNSGTQLTRFVRSLAANHRIALTGTPIENRLSELWSISEWINPGYLGSERSFRRTFVESIERREEKEAAVKLSRIIQPFMLRRLKSDPSVIDDLPDKIEQTSYCALTQRQAALYAAAVNQMTAAIEGSEGMRRRGVILSTITKLKQICNAPAHALRERTLVPGSSGKLMRLEELLLEAVSIGDRSIVFTQYAAMANLLQPYLSERLGCEVGIMIGRTPRVARERLVERFQVDADGPKVLILSLKTGGFGLNLTRANRLIHYDRWWNPASERQATDRAHRIGQTREVEVWKLVTKGTLEESIERMLETKERLAENVVGAGEERWLTEYSDEELRTLLSLRDEIVLEEAEQ